MHTNKAAIVDALLNRLSKDDEAFERFLDAPVTVLEEVAGEPVDDETLRAIGDSLDSRRGNAGVAPLSDEALDNVVGALFFLSRLKNETAQAAVALHVTHVLTFTL